MGPSSSSQSQGGMSRRRRGNEQAMLKPRDRAKAAESGCITEPKRAGAPTCSTFTASQEGRRVPAPLSSSAHRLLHHLQVKLLQGQTVNGLKDFVSSSKYGINFLLLELL